MPELRGGLAVLSLLAAVGMASGPAATEAISSKWPPAGGHLRPGRELLQGDLTRGACSRKYSQRSLIDSPALQQDPPPLLWTFPGSGNTWARLLVEYGTGLLTGSVYNDKALMDGPLPGEAHCDSRVVLIKAHPHTHPFRFIDNGPFAIFGKRCDIRHGFPKAVMLIRDPFDAIWSEYQRRVSHRHTGKIKRAAFRRADWESQAMELANEYMRMWQKSYDRYNKKYPGGGLVVKYEDLRRPGRGAEVLGQILAHIGRPQPQERLRCAFLLAEHSDVNRGGKSGAEQAEAVTKEEAYTEPLACKMWSVMGQDSRRTGYGMWKGWSCDGVDVSTVAATGRFHGPDPDKIPSPVKAQPAQPAIRRAAGWHPSSRRADARG